MKPSYDIGELILAPFLVFSMTIICHLYWLGVFGQCGCSTEKRRAETRTPLEKFPNRGKVERKNKGSTYEYYLTDSINPKVILRSDYFSR